MKYRLTDSAREDVICCAEGEIDDEFVKHAKAIGRNWINLTHTVYICDIVDIPEGNVPPAYNPFGWNNYPDVTPPVGVWMRTEYVNRETGETVREAARYQEFEGNFYWFNELDFDVEVDRFRPWDD